MIAIAGSIPAVVLNLDKPFITYFLGLTSHPSSFFPLPSLTYLGFLFYLKQIKKDCSKLSFKTILKFYSINFPFINPKQTHKYIIMHPLLKNSGGSHICPPSYIKNVNKARKK